MVFACQHHQIFEIVQEELPVRVRERDQVVIRGLKARSQSGPVTAVLLVAAVILGSLLSPCFADEPAPDPSGTVTGDRNTTTDAAGNPFVVPAPPDPSAPDYAQKRKTMTSSRPS